MIQSIISLKGAMYMIDVYFMLDGKNTGDCVGGLSLYEVPPKGMFGWYVAYKVYYITDKTILFQQNNGEFCTTNGTYEHGMGTILTEVIKGNLGDKWLHVQVKEKK